MHNPHRLPRTILPERYALTLAPDLVASTFDGAVDIDVEVVSATDQVVLNAIELEIDDAWVTVGTTRHDVAVSLDAESERATLTLDAPLPVGEAVVSLRFRGQLNDKLRGFYRSTFTDDDGAERVIATTQFEATDARRAFPCWDEPDLKARFTVTLEIDDDLHAVSNASIVADEVLDGQRRVRFAETMTMSTYLVAFIVGPLEVTEPIDVQGTPVRIFCPPGKLHLTGFGLDVAEFSLVYLADYFDIPYPGDSMDLIAIPDFAFGAMENLGCVTFRETLLLADPDLTTRGELQNIVDVIAHELAHMWFGDLVTMKWWNGIWLNEAFATFMELKVTDAFRPEWERWVSFGLARSTAFDTDALRSTRPIEYPVVSPHDAEGMFDVLTYEKGAAVVRMLEQYLGEDSFRAGIRKYMANHQYANTETTDLWDSIEEASGEPVRRIMDSWILQGGHPIVSISVGEGGGVLHLTQERFSYLADEPDDTRWAIPLQLRYALTTGEIVTARALLDGDELDIELPGPVAWVVGNAEGHGFYRVRLSPELRTTLAATAHDTLSDVERYGLVDDTWAAVLSGTTSVAEFLDLTDGFSAETDVSVWRRLLGGLDQVDRLVDGEARTALQARVRVLVGPALERLGWVEGSDDTDRDRELRGALIGAMATLGADPDALAHVAELFATLCADPTSVEANVAAAVVRATAASAGPAEIDALVERFERSDNPQQEVRFLYALADVRDPEQMARVLELAMSPAVRTQNAPFLIGSCIANRDNAHQAWKVVHEHWDEMNERFPSNSIVRMLYGIRSVSDPALAADIEAFTAEHPVPQAKQALQQHLERMRVSVQLREREAAGLTRG